MSGSYLLATHTQLDLVDTKVYMVVHNLSHLFRAVGVSGDTGNQVSISPGDFFAIGKVSWTWNIACIDGISDNNIQSILGRCRTETPILLVKCWEKALTESLHGVTTVNIALSTSCSKEGMLFDT